MKVSRLNSIEQYVISRETVSIDELCEVFGVSKNTIRRDLNELEQRVLGAAKMQYEKFGDLLQKARAP